MSDQGTLTGGCLCGAVQSEARGAPFAECHLPLPHVPACVGCSIYGIAVHAVRKCKSDQRRTTNLPVLAGSQIGISADTVARHYSLNATPVP